MKKTPAKSFTDLLVWQKAHKFVLETYAVSASFPKEEIYTLTSQLRRASISVPANIAEGFKKRGKNDKARLMNISQGSLEECRYYLILAKDLKYIKTDSIQSNLDEICKMLDSYISAIYNSNF